MAARIQLRRDTSAVWVVANPILAQGEVGLEVDTMKAKIGNGIDSWNALPYSIGATVDSDKNYTHDQGVPATVWAINHGLNKFPSVFVVDSAGSQVEGDVSFDDINHVTVTFSGAFSGRAYLN